MRISSRQQPYTPDEIQGRLFILAAVFLAVYSLALTLSPAVPARSWEVSFRWNHWLGYAAWASLFALVHRQSARRMPDRDPFLLPLAALLTGWGLLTIYRLLPTFGLRQTAWLVLSGSLLIAGMQYPQHLVYLRRYKYVWLTSGLVLTGLTLLFGVNPMGAGPEMWLGCCGIYLQPSEPLKLLLVVYLAAYLAGEINEQRGIIRLPPSIGGSNLLPLLAPTFIMTGLALLLLLVQRDLGTASIFIFLYTAIVYVTSARRSILAVGGLVIVLSAVSGYWLFDVVRVRVDAWLNPWLDPSGRSYQIVQSLLAIANGGLIGRGPGIGSPSVVPVSHSDFIFASITEETGLIGAIAFILLIALLAARGLRVALRAPDSYRRYLAAGLTTYLVAQSVLIIGGNLRLLPLTGVTLPFVSYGGSSLLTANLSLLFLVTISSSSGKAPARLPAHRPYLQLGGLLLAGLGAAALITGWWTIFRSPDLLARTDNPRRSIADRYVRRGTILDRQNNALSISAGEPGEITRKVIYPSLSPVIGYTNPVFGQAGLEASLDPYLRGMLGNPGLTIWWNHLVYGQPPPGLDVRLNLDLSLQALANQLLAGRSGALALLDARTGEILALASHPAFDANTLAEDWETLVNDERAPLLNRTTQGLYQPGPALGPFLLAAAASRQQFPNLPGQLSYRLEDETLDCALPPPEEDWPEVISSGCPAPLAAIGQGLGTAAVHELYAGLGLFQAPQIRLPVAVAAEPGPDTPADLAALGTDFRVTPLQMAMAAAALTAEGQIPAPQLVAAVNTTQAGWVPLPPLQEPLQALPADAATSTASSLAVEGAAFWQTTALAFNGPDQTVTWYLGGTLPDQGAHQVAVAIVLEEAAPQEIVQIGQNILQEALLP